MKLFVCATLLLAAIAVPTASSAATLTVTLEVGTYLDTDWRACDVTVPVGSTVARVLDQAVADGCILEWSAAEFPGYGRYVNSIDHVAGLPVTYWAFYVDGFYADTGIDATPAASGHTYRFAYEQWVVPA